MDLVVNSGHFPAFPLNVLVFSVLALDDFLLFRGVWVVASPSLSLHHFFFFFLGLTFLPPPSWPPFFRPRRLSFPLLLSPYRFAAVLDLSDGLFCLVGGNFPPSVALYSFSPRLFTRIASFSG